MSFTPIAYAEGLRIGTVDFVSPDEIKVQLDIEAPDAVALNAGGARPFPRVNSYVLIPVDDSLLVGQVEWLTTERSPFPQRRGVKDFGLIDLPYPLRKMSLNPLGGLRRESHGEQQYRFRRGSGSLPSVGTAVLLPTENQLRAIVESGERRRVRIGLSPMAGNAEVCVDPDRLFGRHLAVLGNTGSGKSCTVAGLIRWSLDAARRERTPDSPPNARFIVLDPNGEYASAFKETVGARVFQVAPEGDAKALKVPHWFWSSAEWAAFAQASSRTQRPTLIQALRTVRDGASEPAHGPTHDARRFFRTLVTTIRIERDAGSPWGSFPKPKSFFEKIAKWKPAVEGMVATLDGDAPGKVQALVDVMDQLCTARQGQYPHYDFTLDEVNSLLTAASEAHGATGGTDSDLAPLDVDAPRPFTGDAFLRSVEAAAEMMNVSEYVETLLIRLRTLLSDTQMMSVLDGGDLTLADWLESYIGSDGGDAGCVTVIDLSLVPSEVVHTVTAVTARIVFEALQRYRRTHTKPLPTVMVMEEAHTFVRRYKDEAEGQDTSMICCRVFERIAREGRKFGLGLVLSSQRPSELSPTVLSQCNTYLLHRISNDRDQELVNRLVPDNLRGLLRELPSLPSQHAVILGWASEIPVLVRIDDLKLKHRPRSDDPDFWDVWTGQSINGEPVERKADWDAIASEWQGTTATGTPDDDAGDAPAEAADETPDEDGNPF